MKSESNIRKRADGRWEARYIKKRDENGKIVYGSCYGKTFEEARAKRDEILGQKREASTEMNLLILGAGSHGQEVFEIAKSLHVFKNISFLDDDENKVNAIGRWNDAGELKGTFSLAIPAIGDAEIRKEWQEKLCDYGYLIPTLVHPTAVVPDNAEIGSGTVIGPRVTISNGAVLGKGCIVSAGAVISRDARVADWTDILSGMVI